MEPPEHEKGENTSFLLVFATCTFYPHVFHLKYPAWSFPALDHLSLLRVPYVSMMHWAAQKVFACYGSETLEDSLASPTKCVMPFMPGAASEVGAGEYSDLIKPNLQPWDVFCTGTLQLTTLHYLSARYNFEAEWLLCSHKPKWPRGFCFCFLNC